nr:PREDICTED: uncharacterized protein LOC109036207 isoform X6 [Bemisia tabaci]XP_018905762.1 PREDICTED: uncharacterized protein LOC109036207 isoform X6 [Bemisia tabaci]
MDRLEHPFEEWCYSLLFLLLTIAYFQENLAQKMSTPGPTWGPTVDPNSRVYSPIRSAEEIEESLRHHMLLPFIISYAPKQMLWMEFIDGFVADIGNDLSGRDVLYPPWLVKWPFKNDSYYAILGTGPDTLVNGLRIRKEFMHWLVVNIPGKHVAGGRAILHGETMADYIGPTPPEGRAQLTLFGNSFLRSSLGRCILEKRQRRISFVFEIGTNSNGGIIQGLCSRNLITSILSHGCNKEAAR